MLKFTCKFLCDGQGCVGQASLYTDRSCFTNLHGYILETS